MRYTFDATGKLSKSELKYTGKNLKEITTFNESGKPVKIEKMSKTDSLIGSTVFVYNSTGQLKEEQHFRGDKLIGKDVSDDEFNEAGRIVQSCHYKMDSLGARIPQNAQMTITEYDNDGLVLQRTFVLLRLGLCPPTSALGLPNSALAGQWCFARLSRQLANGCAQQPSGPRKH
jgi:hypothetical protein